MPRTSIVVPVRGHQVDRCLASLVRQRLDDIEVLLVGGPVPPGPDERFRAVGDDGTDEPRTAGAALATGTYLVFLEPEDEIVPLGLSALVDALERSSADVALGTGGAGRGSVAGLTSAHQATTPQRLPALLEHSMSSATIWRRSTWDRLGLRWPADPAWERSFLAQALLAVASVDVVPEPVTRAQAGGEVSAAATPSLRTDDLPALADRLDALHEVARRIEVLQVRRHWESAVLEPELRRALAHLGEADEAVRERIVERVAQVLDEAGPHLEDAARAVHRLQYHLARRRLLPQLLEVVKADRTGELTLLRAVRRGGAWYGDYPFREDRALAVPREVYRLDREHAVRARVDDTWWEGDTLHVEGYAHLGLVDADTPSSQRLRLALVRTGSQDRVKLPVERVHRPDVTADTREAAYSYDWSGFRTSLDVRTLRDRNGWTYGTWRLEATVSGGGVKRSRLVTATSPGRARHPELHRVDDVRLVATTGRATFAVEVDTLPASVTATAVRDGDLVVEGEVRRRLTEDGPARVMLARPSGSTALVVDDVVLTAAGRHRTFTLAVPLSDLASAASDEPLGEAAWALRIYLPGTAKTVPLRAADRLPVLHARQGDQDVEVRPTPHGRVALSCRPARPVVDCARWAGDALELSGGWPGTDHTVALVSRDSGSEHPLSPDVTDGRFRLRLSPGAVPTLGGDLPLTQGSWRPVVRRGESASGGSGLLADRDVLAVLPLRHTVGAKTFQLTEQDGTLELVAGPDLLDDERGAANQHRLHLQDFPRFVAAGLRDEVLFESYESRAYADNARAVLEELARRGTGLRCRWVVVDGQAALPAGIEAVRRGSRDYYEALARSRYVVVPNYRPLHAWLETPKDQVVVQTWHGAPFKRVALDNRRGEAFSSRDYHEMLRRETSRWDYLLSPNPTSTPILRRAFAYDGEMLETGYPRTDVFHAPDRHATAAAVRDRLGLPDGKRVVLYAPTMRDDRNYGNNRFSLDLRLDLEAARRELGDDHVVLVRRHAKVVDTVSAADGNFARDVSLWPDVNELLLVTDVLVTDYSSLMFDFANTGRPMLFFTYDLEDYRDRLRGLYFDPARLPGPHLGTSQEVIAGIRDADRHHREHAETYRDFVAEFCVWDDGKASTRFVDRVFADHV